MGEFVIYSVKVSMCLIMFYVFYKLLLSRTTLHTFNRFVILALVAVSLMLPFIHLTVEKPVVEGTVKIDQLLMMAMVVEQEQPEFHLSAISLIVLIYLIGVAGFFIKMLISYFGIHRIMKKASTVVDEGGVRIFVVDDDIAPFSWFRNIVISAADYLNHREAIITHEKAHVRKCHSLDIMLCNLLTVLQWFNPAAWLLKAELQNVHEFEADEAVLDSGIDAVGYQLLLVRKAVGDRLFAIANNLNKYSLKKRITMMKTKKTSRWASMKALVVLPLAAVAVVAFATPKMAEVEKKVVSESQQLLQAVEQQVTEQIASVETSTEPVENSVVANPEKVAMRETSPVVQDEKVFDIVEVMPGFPGGTLKMMEYLRDNLKYPKEAVSDNIQGRVIVQFVVTKTGDITDAKIFRSVHPLLDAEALHVVNSMPKWTPGKQKGKPVNVKFSIPVSFRLSGGEAQPTKENAATEAFLTKYSETGLVVDGKEMPLDSLGKINPQEIDNIVVNKDAKMTNSNIKPKNGVIYVYMKKK